MLSVSTKAFSHFSARNALRPTPDSARTICCLVSRMPGTENALWEVQEHIIPASHPRGYHRGVRDPFKSRLRLHVKQYRLQDVTDKKSNVDLTPLTLILVHGIGSTKESYEPLLSYIVTDRSTPPIRQIFSFDMVDHGQSYLLNCEDLGNEPHSLDAARDLLQLVNHFQLDIGAPVVGISQSAGAYALLMASSWSPRLFQAIVCIEPVVENGWWHLNEGVDGTLPLSSFPSIPASKHVGRDFTGVLAFLRRDVWPSRSAAEWALGRSKYYSKFDKAVLEKVFQYDLRPLVNSNPEGPVTLTTPSFLEAAYFMRLDPPLLNQEEPDFAGRTLESQHVPGFYSAGPTLARSQMGNISTRILYVWAPKNKFTNSKYHQRIKAMTGTNSSGAGGMKTGQIDEAYVEKGGHTLPFDNPHGTARQVAQWLGGKWWQEWQQAQNRWREAVRIGKDTEEWAEWNRRILKL